MKARRFIFRVGVTLAAGLGAALLLALGLTLLELYQTGHSRPSLSRMEIPGLSMSFADAIFTVGVLLAVVLTYRAMRPRDEPPTIDRD